MALKFFYEADAGEESSITFDLPEQATPGQARAKALDQLDVPAPLYN